MQAFSIVFLSENHWRLREMEKVKLGYVHLEL